MLIPDPSNLIPSQSLINLDAGKCLPIVLIELFPRARLSVEKAIEILGMVTSISTHSGGRNSRQNHYFFSSCAFAEGSRESQLAAFLGGITQTIRAI